MNERIKMLRKCLDMTQDEFSSKIGLSRNFIAQIETGAKSPSDRTIKDICREFNINEIWLRTGKGDMYKLIEDEVSAAASDITDSDDDFIKDFIVIYRSLSSSSKYALQELIMGIHTRMKAREEKEGEQD